MYIHSILRIRIQSVSDFFPDPDYLLFIFIFPLESPAPSSSADESDSADEHLKALRKKAASSSRPRTSASASAGMELETSIDSLEPPSNDSDGDREQPPPAKKNRHLSAKEICRENIQNALGAFAEQRGQIKIKKRPLHEIIISDYPTDLQEIALLLSALPPTQVSVERLFSSLKYIKSDLRNKMAEDLLNAILFLRANV